MEQGWRSEDKWQGPVPSPFHHQKLWQQVPLPRQPYTVFLVRACVCVGEVVNDYHALGTLYILSHFQLKRSSGISAEPVTERSPAYMNTQLTRTRQVYQDEAPPFEGPFLSMEARFCINSGHLRQDKDDLGKTIEITGR